VTETIKKVRQATRRRTSAEQAWRDSIRDALAGGASLRRVAEAAGVSHVRVLQIREQVPPDGGGAEPDGN
jgi:transposase-like protein